MRLVSFDDDVGTFDGAEGAYDDDMGIQFDSAQGTTSPGISIALVGIALAVSVGSISPNNDGFVPLTGSSVSTAQETIAPSWSQALTGSAGTGSAGTITLDLRPTNIVGQVLTSASGTIIASGDGVTVNISGVEATFFTGDVINGGQQTTSQVVTSTAGTASPVLELPLTGSSVTVEQGLTGPDQAADDVYATFSQGTPVSLFEVALEGAEFTSSVGDVAVTGDVTETLKGAESTAAAGSLEYNKQEPLTGSVATFAQEPIGAPGFASLSGIEVTTTAGNVFTTNDRDYALTGVSMTISEGSTFASPLAFVEGALLLLEIQDIGPREVTLSGVEITSEMGIVDIPRKNQDAGSPRKKKKHTVEIDGQVYEVSNRYEAEQLAERLREIALKKAQEAIKQAQRSPKIPKRKILQDARKALIPPEIAPEPVKAEIEDIYKDTLRTIEISYLMRKLEEEEDEFLLMLL